MSSLKEEFDKKKSEIAEDISETKESISKAASKGVKNTKWFFKRLFTFAAIGLVVFGLLYMVYCNWTYSEGSRTGVLVKISQKGYIFKTNEGQLNVGGFSTDESGMIGNVWSFSLTDDAVYQQLQALEGQKVTLNYEEINKAMPWQGDTNYFITSVEAK